MRKTYSLGLILAMLLVASSLFASAEEIRGTVTYRERIALLPGAKVTVLLLDGEANKPDFIIAQETFTATSQVPIPFSLTYDPGKIKPNQKLGLWATIEEEGRISWSTKEVVPLIPGQRMELLLRQQTAPYRSYETESFNFEVRFTNQKAALTLPGGKLVTLGQVPAARGTKYSGDGFCLETRGNHGLLSMGPLSFQAQRVRTMQGVVTYKTEALPFAAAFDEELLWLELAEEKLALRNLPAFPATKYQNKNLTFWSRGQHALLRVQGLMICAWQKETNPWSLAKKRGVEFRAIGQEPGWLLELTGNEIKLVADYGETVITTQLLEKTVDPQTGKTNYQSRGSLEFSFEVEDKIHIDVMSGEPMPQTVILNLGGKRFLGGGHSL